jgi:hypothetical protein
MKNGRPQREIKPAIKAEVDAFIIQLMEKYPEIARSSLKTYIKDEASAAMSEYEVFGKVLTNRERWC